MHPKVFRHLKGLKALEDELQGKAHSITTYRAEIAAIARAVKTAVTNFNLVAENDDTIVKDIAFERAMKLRTTIVQRVNVVWSSACQ